MYKFDQVKSGKVLSWIWSLQSEFRSSRRCTCRLGPCAGYTLEISPPPMVANASDEFWSDFCFTVLQIILGLSSAVSYPNHTVPGQAS